MGAIGLSWKRRAASGVIVGVIASGTCALMGACAGAAPTNTKVTTESTTGSVLDAGPAPDAAFAPTSESVAPPASAPVPAAGPMPTGGSVLVGDIAAAPGFDPKATLVSAKPDLVTCYNKARQTTPSLRGKLTLRINVNEVGKVMLVDSAPGGTANDPALVSCLSDTLRVVTFPKPNGSATVSAPLVFRP
jgi:hypothetical protein